MAPDRGSTDGSMADETDSSPERDQQPLEQRISRSEAQKFLAERASQPQNFTLRGILCGLVVGVVVVFSNTYFGLQTGWISGMNMPSALIGFAFFQTIQKINLPFFKNSLPFTPVENVLIQTVSGSVGTMPLGCGFVGVMPALEYLLKPGENGPLNLSLGKLCIWAIGICLFGVVLAVPLRKEVIIREKLKFPSGTATALMIGVLHGQKGGPIVLKQEDETAQLGEQDEHEALMAEDRQDVDAQPHTPQQTQEDSKADGFSDWRYNIKLMTSAFAISAVYTILSYFVPQIRKIPIFGLPLARTWLWTFNPSPAYIGQGIIMGPATTAHMLVGAIIGWGILSPLAKYKGWAPGPVSSWENGSKGWIVWVSLAIMLADALVSLGFLVGRPIVLHSRSFIQQLRRTNRRGDWSAFFRSIDPFTSASQGTRTLHPQTSASTPLIDPSTTNKTLLDEDEPEADAPLEHLVSLRSFTFYLIISLALYFAAIHLAFPSLMPFSATLLALLLATFLSILGVRALGETDLNPVSGISKLTQLAFAAIIPASNPNAVIINLLAGAVAESGALQAGDLMQDLKTGHLLGAAPNAQFYGQLIGSVVGAVASAAAYKMYTHVYEIPSQQFQVPTAFVWVFTARLVTGKGLPPHAAEWALGAAILFGVLTAVRTLGRRASWQPYVPGGIAVAVGMYNEPNFTLARAVGGLIAWWWIRWRKRDETNVVVLASGLILGEGLFSIVNLGLASGSVPHL